MHSYAHIHATHQTRSGSSLGPRCCSQRLLLVGVLSFALPRRAERREAIRRLCPSNQLVDVRFVLPADEAISTLAPDAAYADVWALPIPMGERSRNGKFYLQTRFFRRALGGERRYQFIGRMDDDAAIQIPLLQPLLQQIAAQGRLDGWLRPLWEYRNVVLGPIRSFYMWDDATLRPTCFDPLNHRRRDARCSLPAAATASSSSGGVSAEAHAAALIDQCCRANLTGPFPFAGGGATIYSRHLLSGLLTNPSNGIDDAERFVRGARLSRPLVNPIDGKLYAPSERHHPSRSILLEDVYFAALLHRLYRDRFLTLVNLPTWDPPYSRRSLRKLLVPALAYHSLKEPAQFDHLAAHWGSTALGSPAPTSPAPTSPAFGSPALGSNAIGSNASSWRLHCEPMDRVLEAAKQDKARAAPAAAARLATARKRPRLPEVAAYYQQARSNDPLPEPFAGLWQSCTVVASGMRVRRARATTMKGGPQQESPLVDLAPFPDWGRGKDSLLRDLETGVEWLIRQKKQKRMEPWNKREVSSRSRVAAA